MSRHKNPPIDPDDPEVKERKCLMCHTMFVSLWAGNRICWDCTPSFRYEDSKAMDNAVIHTNFDPNKVSK